MDEIISRIWRVVSSLTEEFGDDGLWIKFQSSKNNKTPPNPEDATFLDLLGFDRSESLSKNVSSPSNFICYHSFPVGTTPTTSTYYDVAYFSFVNRGSPKACLKRLEGSDTLRSKYNKKMKALLASCRHPQTGPPPTSHVNSNTSSSSSSAKAARRSEESTSPESPNKAPKKKPKVDLSSVNKKDMEPVLKSLNFRHANNRKSNAADADLVRAFVGRLRETAAEKADLLEIALQRAREEEGGGGTVGSGNARDSGVGPVDESNNDHATKILGQGVKELVTLCPLATQGGRPAKGSRAPHIVAALVALLGSSTSSVKQITDKAIHPFS